MISDDDLLLYHYRDGLEPAERARIGAALAEQPELAQRLHRLVSRLDAAAAIPEVEVPLQVAAALAQCARPGGACAGDSGAGRAPPLFRQHALARRGRRRARGGDRHLSIHPQAA